MQRFSCSSSEDSSPASATLYKTDPGSRNSLFFMLPWLELAWFIPPCTTNCYQKHCGTILDSLSVIPRVPHKQMDTDPALKSQGVSATKQVLDIGD